MEKFKVAIQGHEENQNHKSSFRDGHQYNFSLFLCALLKTAIILYNLGSVVFITSCLSILLILRVVNILFIVRYSAGVHNHYSSPELPYLGISEDPVFLSNLKTDPATYFVVYYIIHYIMYNFTLLACQ